MEITKELILERFQADRFATQVAGVEIVDAAVNYAKVKLNVEPRHFNAVGIVQGGALFTLGDFAFAVASNAGQEETVVAIECNLSFMKPTTGGALFAEAKLISRSKSLCSYDVLIMNEKNELVAKFYGRGFVRRPK
ncbi:MAG: PaaI family thioesterase [Planctomycetaceae bacterium]|jgi:acyl-CoA thioesterase|nr:PaaI family thioesterase [Planctomycetaceae bacterium]